MHFRFITSLIGCAFLFTLAGCATESPAPTTGGGAPGQQQSTKITSALPDAGFKASVTIIDPPPKLRAGEQVTLQVRVKNASGVNWPAMGMEDGRFAITLRNRWLAAGRDEVVNDLDGGTSLPYDLGAGTEVVMPLKVSAPKKMGEYDLEVDMVQEQVNFFHARGSHPAKVKMRVE